jgi:hypothetical protein
VSKVRTPDNKTGHQQDKYHAHDAPEHHLLTGIIFADIRYLCSLPFRTSTIPLIQGDPVYREYCDAQNGQT